MKTSFKRPLASLLSLALLLSSVPAPVYAAGGRVATPAVETGVRPGVGVFAGLTPAQSGQLAQSLSLVAAGLPALAAPSLSPVGSVVPVVTPAAPAAEAASVVTALAPRAAADPVSIEGRAHAAVLAALWGGEGVTAELSAGLEALGTPEGASAAAALREAARVYRPGVEASRAKLSRELPALRKLGKLQSASAFFDGDGAIRGLTIERKAGPVVDASDVTLLTAEETLGKGPSPRVLARLAKAPSGSVEARSVLTVERPVDMPLYRPTEAKVKPSITNRWVQTALLKDDEASRVLLANYAPSSAELAATADDSLPALRQSARDDSLGVFAELRALPGVEEGPAKEDVTRLREQLISGDSMGAMRSAAAVSAAYAPALVGSEQAAEVAGQVQEKLQSIYGVQLALKTAVDHLKMSADGIGRNFVHYWTPDGLALEMTKRGWHEQKVGEPVVDAVVVGGGPSGLAAAYYLSEANGKNDPGLKTVLIEGGYVGQAFSDGGSPSVHWLRTGRWTTSLATTGVAPMRHIARIGLPRVSKLLGFKARGQAARADVEERTEGRYIGRSREERKLARFRESKNPFMRAWGWLESWFFYSIREHIHPIARNEIFQYFNHVGAHIAENPNAIVLEQSPVSSWRKLPNGLWEVKTAQGHRVLARRLVIGTGIVGTDGDNAQVPKEFAALQEQRPENHLTVTGFPDLNRKSGELAALFNERVATGRFGKQLMMPGTLIRTPEAQRWLKSLPDGSRVAVIGSGESAAKDVVDILIQNPKLKVVIFAKAQFEPAQVQVPEAYFAPELAKRGIVDPEFAKFSVDQWKRVFGTPITPQTMIDMITAQKEGRVEVYELGKHFTGDIMALLDKTTKKNGIATQVEITDSYVVDSLKSQKATWEKKYGLTLDIGEPSGRNGANLRLPPITGGFFFSTGFAAGKTRTSPLMQQLLDGGHVDLVGGDVAKWYKGQIVIDEKNRLTSAKDKTLAFTGISFYNPAGDSTIAGMGVRGLYIGHYMKKSLREEARAEAYGRGSAIMSIPTLERLSNLPTYERLPGTQKSYRKEPAANPVTLDPSLALLEILPYPIITTLALMLTGTAGLNWLTMLAIPATLVPGLSRWLPYYKQLFRRPIDVIVRRLDVRSAAHLPMSGTDKLVIDRAHQLETRQALPLDRFHLWESLRAIAGLIASFRWYRPFAIDPRVDVTPSISAAPAAANDAPKP